MKKRLRGPQFLEQRFWSKVNRTSGCWVWSGYKNRKGYGVFSMGNTLILAHRFRWQLSNGPIPEGKRVLHRCDRPSRVRVDHLFLGSQADNVQDMMQKGRGRKASGERHGRSKLGDVDVAEIKRLLAEGVSGVAIGQHFGVSRSTVSTIRLGKRVGGGNIIKTGKVLE